MRETEFRVWDSRKKSYFNKKDIAIDNLGNIFAFEVCDDNDADLWHVRILSDPDNERYIIEDNTGLTDKNGTEIYEGDIIQFEFWNEKYYRQIAYNSAIASYEAITVTSPTSKKLRQKAKYSFSELYKISSKGFKVVGNIHENPERLEEK